jgi:tetratricopeptide (TPR) repeat protein
LLAAFGFLLWSKPAWICKIPPSIRSSNRILIMKFRPHIVAVLLFVGSLLLLLSAPQAIAQDSQDNQPHIQPRTSPTPTPTPTPSPSPTPKPSGTKDQYERPPFPGDVQKPQANQPSPKPGDDKYERPPFPGDMQKPQANEPSPKPGDDKYERPPFPGDAPGSNPTGGSVTGESSSKDSQIDTDSHSTREEPEPPAEDPSVLTPWDPHKAAKDVEVGKYYLKLKNYRAALERFNHALTYKANDAEAIFGLAITQEKLDLLQLADQNYRKYLEILPNGPKSKDAQEGLQRVAPHVAMRKPADVNANPAQVAAHNINVGETYLSTNNFDSARERFEEALRLTPDNPLIWFRLAQALQGVQRLDPARLYYKKYLEAQPKGKFAGNAKKAISQIEWQIGK